MIEIAKTEIYQTCSAKSTIYVAKKVTESLLVLNLQIQVFKACFARREAKNEQGQLEK